MLTHRTDYTNIMMLCVPAYAITLAVSRRRSVPAEARLDPRSVHVRFMVDKVVLGRVFLRIRRYFPVSINPPMLQYHLRIHDRR
jgi:hypothetical protein